MPEFTRSEAKAIAACVTRFADAFHREVDEILKAQFRGATASEVTEFMGQLALLQRQLEATGKPVRVHDAYSGLLKRVLIAERRENADAIDVPLQKAIDAQLIKALKRDLQFLEYLMLSPWFVAAQAVRAPRLTDYLSIRHAEAALPEPLQLRPREYDEKFHILEAPSLFLPDLAYYRKRCRFRGANIAIAYIDIDDFKAFNTEYTETAVDLHLLTPFMEAIEAHVFCHGHAYRFGGDEYLLTLPNMSRPWVDDFLRALQARLAASTYRGVRRAPTISIGLCVVDADCFLTDREVLARANEAKNYAKANQKGRIATFEGPLFLNSELALV